MICKECTKCGNCKDETWYIPGEKVQRISKPEAMELLEKGLPAFDSFRAAFYYEGEI